MNGEALRKARVNMGLTQEETAELLNVDTSTYQRWEAGITKPYPHNRRQIHTVLHIPLTDLAVESKKHHSKQVQVDLFALQSLMPANLSFRLACLARHPDYNSIHIQQAITYVIEEHMRMNPNDHAALTRREALQNLATFFALLSGEGTKLPTEETLKSCAAGITACGYLSWGNHEDMKLASRMLTEYIPALKNVANASSKHQEAAIGHISQALQIRAILEHHQSARYAEQAVRYAKMSNNIVLQVTAARELGNSYRAEHHYDRALQVVEEANALLDDLDDGERMRIVSPFLQSWFYSGLAAFSAYQGKDDPDKKQQALTAIEKAKETFFVPLDNQILPGFINHNEANLAQNVAEAYSHLGMADEGLATLENVIDFENDLPFAKVPTAQRTHVSCLLNAALISLKLPKQKKDKKLSIKLWIAGIEGAKSLQHEFFFQKALTAHQIMESLWSDEQDVQDLRDLIKKDW